MVCSEDTLTFVVDETDVERNVLDASVENVLLVQEQDRRRRREARSHVTRAPVHLGGPSKARI